MQNQTIKNNLHSVAAVAVLPTVLGPSVDVRFEYLNATDTVLEYIISFNPVTEDNDLSIVIETPNGATVREEPAEGDVASGTIEGLLPGNRYEVVVMDGSSEVASRSVVMALTRRTALTGVEHECHCAVDGSFHFQIFFTDENDYWSDFSATLTDEFGTQSQCDFSDDPHAEHTLDVNGVGMRGNTAVLRIVCMTTEPDENGDRTPREFLLYEETVSI